MNYLLPQRLDRLAREYALGTLAGRARRRFERVLLASPAARMAVQTWQQRLSVLDAANVPLQPPVTNWRAIEQRLFPAPAAQRAPGGLVPSLLGLLRRRRLGSALTGAVTGALACVFFLRLAPGVVDLEPRADTLPASYVGLLLDAAGKPTLVASSRRQGKVLTVKLLQPITIPPGQVAELWALPSNGAPFPVGTLPASGSAHIALPASSEKLFANVQDLGVSYEAAPAKAGAAPAAAFVLTGHCVKVW